MKRLITLFLFAIVSVKALAVVDIDLNGQHYRYLNPVRLSLILQVNAKNGDWYWPASAIYKIDQEYTESLRQDVLQSIDSLAVDLSVNDDKAIALNALRQQVQQWTLAKRLPLTVNKNAARVDASLNPMFQDGNYIMRLSGRPTAVWMSGMVSTPGSYEYRNQHTAADYAEGVKLRNYADPDFVYVISPRGEVSKLNVAYWGESYSQLMPGSQIFVPLFSWLLSLAVEELNEKVAALAVHRVLP